MERALGYQCNMRLFKSNNGFTLVELTLVVVFITLVAGLSVPVYQRFQNSNDLDLAAMELTQTLRRAQVLSLANDGDSNWGVYSGSGQILLFKGASSTTRDANFDEVFSIPASIQVSGLSEIVFDKFSGEPQITGSIIISSNNNDQKTITINSKGLLEY